MPRLRPFGCEEIDLGIDFDARNRASLVTRLLAHCTVDPVEAPHELYRALSAGRRLDYLLRLAAGGPDQALAFPCTCGGCRATLELELTIRELSELQRRSEAVDAVGVELGGQLVRFRKPTGRDLEAWAEMVFDDERDAVTAMIATLAVDRPAIESLDAAALGAIEDALDDADPLIDFSCVVRCDECGESNARSIDLMETALGMLRRAQEALVSAVHRLASQYHWSERDIFAVPAWRRQQYLRLIASGR